MATITNAVLALTHDHHKKTVQAVAKCKVNFTPLELCQMKTCSGDRIRHFKLKCELRGEDKGFEPFVDVLFGRTPNPLLFTYSNVFFFPDGSPSATESRSFDVLLGEGVLDEDTGQDEVFGLFRLVNLSTLVQVTKKTNTVSHSF